MAWHESYRHEPSGGDVRIAPGVWIHEPGTPREWVEAVVTQAEWKQKEQKRREYFSYFYTHYRRLWSLEEKISDTAVRGEPPRKMELSEEGYLIGAAQSADGLLMVDLLKARLPHAPLRVRQRILSRGCELAFKGRFKLTEGD